MNSYSTGSTGLPLEPDRIRQWMAAYPRVLRFLGVGSLGLITDLGLLIIAMALGFHPLTARLISLACATLVTWRLNRALTFDRSGRHPSEEAVRYALVTLVAQGISYTVFAVLVLTVLGTMPLVAAIAGAAAAAAASYNGHRLFAFAEKRA